MILVHKLLRLQEIPEPMPPAPTEPGKAPVRYYPRIVLYNPAFGQSLPGEEFPSYLIPNRLRPPELPQWKLLNERRGDLSEDDMLDDDPFCRALRPSLRDPLRLTVLAYRGDLYPRDLDRITDPNLLDLLLIRRDLNPRDVVKMRHGFRSALLGCVPLPQLGQQVQYLCRESVQLLKRRPDLRPDQLCSILRTVRSRSEDNVPENFLAALENFDGRSGAYAA